MARNILMRLTGDPSGAKRAIRDVKGDVQQLDGLDAKARVDIKDEAAKLKLDKLNKRLGNLGRQEQTPDVKIRTASVVRQIERIEQDLDRAIGKNRRLGRITGGVRDGAGTAGVNAGALGAVGASAKAGVAGVVGAVGLGGAVLSAKAAIEAEQSRSRLRAQLRAGGKDLDDYAAQIDKTINAQSRLSGLDDEDLQDSFTNIFRVTGDVTKSLKLNALAADFARAKHIDVAKAGEIVGKVAGGNTGILSRYGIQVKKGATASEALGLLQKKFAGQAEAYGKTTQGSLDRLGVAAENLGEEVGKNLTPAIQFLADTLPKVGPAVREVVRDVANFPGVRDLVAGIRQSLRGLVTFIKGVFHGDIGEAWDGIKDIFVGRLRSIRGLLRIGIEPIRRIGKSIGNALKSGIHQGLDGLVGLARSVLNKVIDAINGLTGGINKLDVLGVIPNIPEIGHVGGGGGGADNPNGIKMRKRGASKGKAGGDPAGRFGGRAAVIVEQLVMPPTAAPIGDPDYDAHRLHRGLRQLGAALP